VIWILIMYASSIVDQCESCSGAICDHGLSRLNNAVSCGLPTGRANGYDIALHLQRTP